MLAARDLTGYNPGLIAPLTGAKPQMIEAGRTPEQQQAVDFMRAAPFDVISANDLSGVLSPAIKFESQKEQQQRHSAVLAVLRELGQQPTRRRSGWPARRPHAHGSCATTTSGGPPAPPG